MTRQFINTKSYLLAIALITLLSVLIASLPSAAELPRESSMKTKTALSSVTDFNIEVPTTSRWSEAFAKENSSSECQHNWERFTAEDGTFSLCYPHSWEMILAADRPEATTYYLVNSRDRCQLEQQCGTVLIVSIAYIEAFPHVLADVTQARPHLSDLTDYSAFLADGGSLHLWLRAPDFLLSLSSTQFTSADEHTDILLGVIASLSIATR